MKQTKFTSRLWKRINSWHPGVVLTVLAVAFVLLRVIAIHAQRPAHLDENAAAYGSIRNFYGPAQFNHDGSQFIFAATADDRGRAIYLADTRTGKKRQIIEDTQGVGIWNDDFDVRAGPWSPDDRYFLCLVSNRLMVCSPNNEQMVIDDKPFSEAVWLTTSRFAYVTDDTTLCFGEKRNDGHWDHHTVLNRNVQLLADTVDHEA